MADEDSGLKVKKSPERCGHLSGEAITQCVEKLEMSLGGKNIGGITLYFHASYFGYAV